MAGLIGLIQNERLELDDLLINFINLNARNQMPVREKQWDRQACLIPATARARRRKNGTVWDFISNNSKSQ
jgi:hypothetical protein